MFDVAVVGGGVIGGFVARELMRYSLRVVILEAGADVATGASRANSGIVHAGYDAVPDSLKARFNLEGNRMMSDVCRELGVKYGNNGSLVLAFDEEQADAVRALYERGMQNGVERLEILDRAAVLEREPNVSDAVVCALYAPTGGIVCPFELTIAAVGNAMDNGAELLTDFRLTAAKSRDGGWVVTAADGRTVDARYVINCAGYFSGDVARAFGDDSFRIGARRGEYILLDSAAAGTAWHTLFTVPTKAGKGVLVSPTVDGNVLIGPTSVEDATFDTSIRAEAFAEIMSKASSMCKTIPYGETITSFAGVRAYADRHDFIVEESAKANALFHAAGIESPGLTSAPAIGKYVATFVANKLGAQTNGAFQPRRQAESFFRYLSNEEKNDIIRRDPDFGKIVCRCESVTLGEILTAVRQNPKARTLDGVKLRTRAGMGRCQSGFCQPYVLELLMKEYGITFDEVTKNGGTSNILIGGEV